jgi:hypothetical protein
MTRTEALLRLTKSEQLFSEPPMEAGCVLETSGSHQFADNSGHGRPSIRRICTRWLASGGAGRELVGRRIG